MSGYEVGAAELRAAAAAGRSAAAQIGTLTPGEDLSAGTAGIPGAPVIASLTQVAQRWQDAVRGWQERTGRHATSLAASATTYGRADDTAAGHLANSWRAL